MEQTPRTLDLSSPTFRSVCRQLQPRDFVSHFEALESSGAIRVCSRKSNHRNKPVETKKETSILTAGSINGKFDTGVHLSIFRLVFRAL